MDPLRLVKTSLLTLAYWMLPTAAFTAGSAFQMALLDDEPVLYYQFNEAAGNVINHGTWSEGFDAAVFGTTIREAESSAGDSGISFDSVDDYVESLGVAPVKMTGNPSFTVEVVVFVPVGGTASLWAPFLHWGDSDPNATAKSVYFSFSSNTPDQVYAGFYNGGLEAPGKYLQLGQWHHMVWIRTGGGTDQEGSVLYIDGNNVTADLIADPGLCCNGSTPIVTSTEFRVNRARDFTRFFTGTIDELALYDKLLTEERVMVHWDLIKNGIFMDSFEMP
jgi:hypothetical protein